MENNGRARRIWTSGSSFCRPFLLFPLRLRWCRRWRLWRRPLEVCLPTWETGLVFRSHLIWWFTSPSGCSLLRRGGVDAASGVCPFFTGEVMADGHLAWPARSSSIRHVGFPDMLLLVPFLNSAASSSGGWSAPRHLPRPPATRATGCSLQGLVCNFLFFEWCLCKLNDVNCQTFL